MGKCSSKEIIDNIVVVRNIISEFVDIQTCGDETKKYKRLLELLYNLDKYPKEQQKIILDIISETLKPVSVSV